MVKTCKVCQKLVNGSIREHLIKNHHHCETCDKWGSNKEFHCNKICQFCHEKVCNIYLHILNNHFKCEDCHKWFNCEDDHERDQCAKCKMPVCNMNHHLAVYISCRDNELLCGSIKRKRVTRFVFVKCEPCKSEADGPCKCYKFPVFG